MLKSTHSQRNLQGVEQPFKGLITSGNLFRFHKSHIFNHFKQKKGEWQSFLNIVSPRVLPMAAQLFMLKSTHSQRNFQGVEQPFKCLITSEKIFKFYKSNISNHFNEKKGEWQSFKNILFYVYYLWRLGFFSCSKARIVSVIFRGSNSLLNA